MGKLAITGGEPLRKSPFPIWPMAMKEEALAKTTPLLGRPGRYKPGDQLMEFLNGL